MKTLDPSVARVLKRLHYPLEVILTCVRWYVAYPLSLRHLEEIMAENTLGKSSHLQPASSTRW
jgi:putative transposase